MQWKSPYHKILTSMESLVSVSDTQTPTRTSSIYFYESTTSQLMVVLIPLFHIFLTFIGHVTFPDHLIHGEFHDASIARIDASPEGDNGYKVWEMHDGSFRTYWKVTSKNGANSNARLKYTFQFPIIFAKLIIVKPPNVQKLR